MNRGWVPTAWKEQAEAAAAVKIRQNAEAAQAKEAAAAAVSKPASAATAAAAAAPASSGWWGWRWLTGGGGKGPVAEQAAPPAQQVAAREIPEPDVVVGVIQYDEQPSQFMPDNKPESEEFHFVQREALVSA